MKKPFAVGLGLGSLLVACICPAADLKQSTFTQVVNDVRIVSAADSSEKSAIVNTVFTMPDLVRTGAASRAELVAEDKTITRVGANTVFSFDPANRTIDLQQGSLLFHSPKGKGGGTIRTGSATASVLGTTIMVTTTRNGGFKVIDLEGHVAIKFLNGLEQHLAPGQMTFVLHDGHPAPVINIRLDTLTKDSSLVHGFDQPLPSLPLIQQQIDDQDREIDSGKAQDTGLLVGDIATHTTVQVVKIDPNTIQSDQQSDGQSSDQLTSNSLSPAPGTISGATLPTEFILSSPFTAGSLTFPFGFSAPNITIGTPTIDLSPYGNVSEFAFVSPNGTLAINGSVSFKGLSSTAILDLYASTFSFASGATVQADVGTFKLLPQTATTLKGVAIVDNAPASSAPGGIIAFEVGSLASSSASTISFPLGGINVVTPAAFSLTNGSSINAPNLPVGLVANSITLNNSSVQGAFVGLDGAAGVNISNSSTLTANSGNLGILTNGSDISISGSTLTAKQGAAFNGSNTGQAYLSATGAAVNLTNGSTISAADAVTIIGDTGVTIADSTITAGAGKNIQIVTATASSAKVSITGSSTATGYTTTLTGNSSITSGGALTVNGATFKADSTSGTVLLSALSGSNTLQNASVTAGTLTLKSATSSDSGSITLNNATINVGTLSPTSGINTGSINVQNSSITTTNALTLAAGSSSGSVTVQNSTINAPSVTIKALSTATSDLITVNQNTSITTTNLTLNSGDGILLGDDSGTVGLHGTGTVNLTAPDTFASPNSYVTVKNTNFSSFSQVNIAGYTINLTGVAFSSSSPVHLTTYSSGTTFNNPTTGCLNFIGSNNTCGTVHITDMSSFSVCTNISHTSTN
jgi:hypothetical protein